MLSFTSTKLLMAGPSTSVTTCGTSPWNVGTRNSSRPFILIESQYRFLLCLHLSLKLLGISFPTSFDSFLTVLLNNFLSWGFFLRLFETVFHGRNYIRRN